MPPPAAHGGRRRRRWPRWSPPPPLLLLLSALAPGRAGGRCTPEEQARFSGGWPHALDAGIYWFGQDDTLEKAAGGERTALYDPDRSTVIYFHGWTGNDEGSTVTCHRVTTRCSAEVCPGASGQLLAEPWLAAGWNVGFFYWDQFADEECVRDAEQKIWFDRNGNGLRWKSFDSKSGVATYDNYRDGVLSVADLCVRVVETALSQHAGPEVRFVGHSIGAQLATRCAALLHHREHPAAPMRLAMLEPYFTKHHLWLFRCVGEAVGGSKTLSEEISVDGGVEDYAAVATRDYARHLWEARGVVIEIYKSSVLTEMTQFGEPNAGLEQFSTYVEYQPHWCGGVGPLAEVDVTHLNCRHDAAFPVYFLSFAQAARPLVALATSTGAAPGSALAACPTPAASCSYGQLRQWINRQVHVQGHQKWEQAAGLETIGLSDDTFALKPGIFETDQAGDTQANALIKAPATEGSAKPHHAGSRLAKVAGQGSHIAAECAALLLTFGCLYGLSRLGSRRVRATDATDLDDSDLDDDDDDAGGEESASLMDTRKLEFKAASSP